jgi:hypothetical protein
MPARTLSSALREAIIVMAAALTARIAAMPLLVAIGNTAAATIEPGSASSIRRTRVVNCTWPISQKPLARIRNVVAAITAILATAKPSGSVEVIEEPRDSASHDRAHDDEPPP